MAIALDTSTNGGNNGGSGTSLTYSHTCSSGSNRALLVACFTSTNNFTTVTYGGVSMSKVKEADNGADHTAIYFLANPASGSNSVVVSIDGGANNIASACASYTGVGGINTSNSASNTSTSISVSNTTTSDNCWLVSFGLCEGGSIVAGANTTVRKTANFAIGDYFIGDSNAAETPAGSFSQAVSCSNGVNAMGAVAIAVYDANTKYWIGGTGTWDAVTPTHWSTSSGGTANTYAPQSANAIVFDGSSGGGTATLGVNVSPASLTFTGYTGTFAQSSFTVTLAGNFVGASGMTWSGSGADSFAGNFTLVSGMSISYSGAITFNATSSGKTITTGGVTITQAVTFNGSGGVWTLQDDFTSSSTITVTLGTFTLSSLSPHTVTLSGTGTVWSAVAGTVSAGSATINLTNSSSSAKTFAGGGNTYYNLTFTSGSSGTYTLTGNNTFNNFYHTGSGTGTLAVTGSNTFADFKIDTPPHTATFTAGTTQTLQTFTVSGTAGNLMTLQSSSNGSPWYMVKSTSGTISRDYLSLRDSHVE